MEQLLKQATGYLVLEADIPDHGLLAGDRIYINSDPQTTEQLVVGMWDDKAHLCQRLPSGTLLDCCSDTAAPPHAGANGGALYVSRAIPSYREVSA